MPGPPRSLVAAILRAAIALIALAPPVFAQTPAPPPPPAGQRPDPPVSVYGVVPREGTGVDGLASSDVVVPTAVSTPSSATPKRGEIVVAPMPMINPTLENGVSLVAGYLYRLDLKDRKTPPSVTAVGGFATSNDSWAGAVVQSLHLKHDRVRVLGVAAYSDINYAFYGIGQSAGDAGVSIELNQVGPVALVESLVQVYPQWFVGARYQILRMTVSTSDLTLPNGPTLPGIDADLRTAALGPRVEFDSRDTTFYPRRGTQFQGIVSLYGPAVGGQRTYQVYQAWVNRYHALGSRNVLAWHVGTCGADGSVTFYDLCMLGKNQDLRGYPTGQYRDRAMVAAQAEWRTELWWRLGATVFAGGGEVASGFDALTWKAVLPGGGAGLRLTLAKRNHVNLRVDYAWGKDSTAFYVGVAEAF